MFLDLNEPSIMNLLKANIAHNKDLIGQGKTPSILPLDFMAETWSQELTHVVSSSDVVVVADGKEITRDNFGQSCMFYYLT